MSNHFKNFHIDKTICNSVLTLIAILISLANIRWEFVVSIPDWGYLAGIFVTSTLGISVANKGQIKEWIPSIALSLTVLLYTGITAYLIISTTRQDLTPEIHRNSALLIALFFAEMTLFLSDYLLKINNSCNRIYEGQKREHVGFSTTCIPLKRHDDGKFSTYLIKNKSQVSQWMAPGGHVMFESQNVGPDIVAKQKAKDEAGLEVEILESAHEKSFYSKVNGCMPLIPPHAAYKLVISSEANCAKELGHKSHVDFHYVGEVINDPQINPNQTTTANKKDQVKIRFEIVEAVIEIDEKGNYSHIKENLDKAVEKHYHKTYGEIPENNDFFPRHFSRRINCAIKYFLKCKNEK